MSTETPPFASVLLWPNGAPGALGEAEADQPKLTIYLPAPSPSNKSPSPEAAEGTFPAVVICPGGGYTWRAPHEAEPIARWLNSFGVAGLVLDYRVAPYRHPIPLGDAQRAIRLARANSAQWRLDPKRIGILGFSAGGHLAASAATIFDEGDASADDVVDRQSSRPDALIACYAVITFWEYRHHGSMTNLLGSNPSDEMRQALSLENRVSARTPPAFIWHTADDSAVPVENSLLLASALGRQKVPFELHVFPSGRHGLGLAGDVPSIGAWTSLCATWLKEMWK